MADRSWFLVFGLLLGTFACSQAEERDGPSIVLEDFRPPDVAEPRVTWKDEASDMLFSATGSAWSRLEGAELAALGPDVRLAVREGARCTGWVWTRPGGQGSAQRAADAARAALGWEGLEVHADEDVKYDMWTARRYEVQGKVDGRVHAERASYWLDDGILHAVVARTSERDYVARRRCLDRVTAGFTLTRYPGPKRGY